MNHYLKIEPRWLNRIRANEKHGEVRRNDRDYQAGDTVILANSEQSYDAARRKITHVLTDVDGLMPGYVVLSLEDSRIGELAGLRRENDRLIRSNRSLRARARMLAGGAR